MEGANWATRGDYIWWYFGMYTFELIQGQKTEERRDSPGLFADEDILGGFYLDLLKTLAKRCGRSNNNLRL